jgi:hypothetical protein
VLDTICSTHSEKINGYKIFVEDLRERERLENLGVDGMKILKCALKRIWYEMRTGFIWLRMDFNAGIL